MAEIDPFTRQRILRFVDSHRSSSGQLPTLKDFEAAGFAKDLINTAVRKGLLSELYVTLTNGTIVKGFKKV
jgi:hypothetical protein